VIVIKYFGERAGNFTRCQINIDYLVWD